MGNRYITIGRVTALFGVSGWVRIHSYTRPRYGITAYSSWHLLPNGSSLGIPQLEASRRHADKVIAKFLGIDDRDSAVILLDRDIAIDSAQLKRLSSGEYYCCELIGLEVLDSDGRTLGFIRDLVETGANDVMVVEGDKDGKRYLIPYVPGNYVKNIDLENGHVEVDWKLEWS